jgi:hypothetical protein
MWFRSSIKYFEIIETFCDQCPNENVPQCYQVRQQFFLVTLVLYLCAMCAGPGSSQQIGTEEGAVYNARSFTTGTEDGDC